jgi:hypothetical protein
VNSTVEILRSRIGELEAILLGYSLDSGSYAQVWIDDQPCDVISRSSSGLHIKTPPLRAGLGMFSHLIVSALNTL